MAEPVVPPESRPVNILKLMNASTKVVALFSDSDLSLAEQAAVFALAREACLMANAVHEIGQRMIDGRKGGTNAKG